jgi:hypothetical protein
LEASRSPAAIPDFNNKETAMPNVHVTISEVIATGSKKKTLTISVDPEPLDLVHETELEVDIDWILDNSAAPLWTFAADGIVIKGHGVHFSDNNGSGFGKKHGWKRKKRNNKKFVYTINLENLADGTTLSWDPRVINN